MAKIEDYGIIGDCHSMGLVSKEGSIDWLCLPRFDSGACFARLLGSSENGYWRLSPIQYLSCKRRYLSGTLILENRFVAEHGEVVVLDFMPPRGEAPDVVRMIKGVRGEVEMECAISLRFDYGAFIPWVRKVEGGIVAVAGPDTIHFHSPIPIDMVKGEAKSRFFIKEGECISFTLTWYRSRARIPKYYEATKQLSATLDWWKKWTSKSTYRGEWKEAVEQSLIVLKALTYQPTGGIVAAATTSLPEALRGSRNWDYRYCWIRDATLALYALMCAGYLAEARAWRDWLLRATAGEPSQIHIMYGVAGERRLTETKLSWLSGYEGARPVRIGNAAHTQLQLDVFGELMDVFHVARRSGLDPSNDDWNLQIELMNYLETIWREPDEGIWEIRGPRRHFTHSKVMAWVALDRAVRAVETLRLEGPVDRWRAIKNEIHNEVCTRGFDKELNSFVQYYGGKDLDASLLMIPMVGFLPPSDPRVKGTLSAIERTLMKNGFVRRYLTETAVDGLPGRDGIFLACSFWYVDNLCLQGRDEEARKYFSNLLDLRNDLGLLSEEYDLNSRRLIGNFPQAFSHVALINSALNLSHALRPAIHRGESNQEQFRLRRQPCSQTA